MLAMGEPGAPPSDGLIDICRIRAVAVAGRLLDRKELDNVLAQVKIAATQ